MQPGLPPETAMKVYRRYLKLEPMHVEEYIAYLKAKVRYFALLSLQKLVLGGEVTARED